MSMDGDSLSCVYRKQKRAEISCGGAAPAEERAHGSSGEMHLSDPGLTAPFLPRNAIPAGADRWRDSLKFGGETSWSIAANFAPLR
jgi:hypothetical protein